MTKVIYEMRLLPTRDFLPGDNAPSKFVAANKSIAGLLSTGKPSGHLYCWKYLLYQIE